MVNRLLFVAPLVSSLSICSGCGGDDASEAVEVPLTYAPATGSGETLNVSQGKPVGPFEKKFAGVTFSVPKGWREVPLTAAQQGFIDGRFLIPVGDEELQLTCSSIGGGVEANVDRWIGQFQLPPGESPTVDTISIGSVEATWVDLRGIFNSSVGAASGARENWRMLGVGIPLRPRDFYLKLTGPADAISEVRDEFRAFVKSARIRP